MSSIMILLIMLFLTILAPVIVPQGPQAQDLDNRLRPPGWLEGKGLFGTDGLGRDVVVRTIYGGRMSLAVGVASVVLAGSLGIAVGLLAGYRGGMWDKVIMWLSGVQLSLPGTIIAIAIMAVLTPSATNVILVLGITNWVTYARVVRGEVMSLKEREFVEAGRAIGAKDLWLIRRYIVPNIVNPVIVIATLETPRMIIAESSLSFLGLGVPLTVPTWGGMISHGLGYVTFAWWTVLGPGIALILTVLSINVIGDWIRDITDPRS